MAKVGRKISKKYRYTFYIVLCISVLSGSAFWLLRRFAVVEGDFGPESHFLQYPFLQLHGFAAFLMLMALGAIFCGHLAQTWSIGRAKKTGITMMSAVIFSILSAYILYYLVSENWHHLLGNAHALMGLALPVLLVFHIRVARKSRRK
jgi:MFS family permease